MENLLKVIPRNAVPFYAMQFDDRKKIVEIYETEAYSRYCRVDPEDVKEASVNQAITAWSYREQENVEVGYVNRQGVVKFFGWYTFSLRKTGCVPAISGLQELKHKHESKSAAD